MLKKYHFIERKLFTLYLKMKASLNNNIIKKNKTI
jgi:hypothetical protein